MKVPLVDKSCKRITTFSFSDVSLLNLQCVPLNLFKYLNRISLDIILYKYHILTDPKNNRSSGMQIVFEAFLPIVTSSRNMYYVGFLVFKLVSFAQALF